MAQAHPTDTTAPKPLLLTVNGFELPALNYLGLTSLL